MRFRVDLPYEIEAATREEAARRAFDMMRRDVAAGRVACLAVYAEDGSDAHAPPVMVQPVRDESEFWIG